MTPAPKPNPVLRKSPRARRSPARRAGSGPDAAEPITRSPAWTLDFRNANVAFLDTGFADPTAPELLSLGLVSWPGEEHYVELDLGLPSSVPVQRRALTLPRGRDALKRWGRVPGSAAGYQEMGLRTSQWLHLQVARFGHPIHVAFRDAPHYGLLERLMRDIGEWDAVREIVCPVNTDGFSSRFTGLLGAVHVYGPLRKRGLEEHHALGGAHALRAACIGMVNGKRIAL